MTVVGVLLTVYWTAFRLDDYVALAVVVVSNALLAVEMTRFDRRMLRHVMNKLEFWVVFFAVCRYCSFYAISQFLNTTIYNSPLKIVSFIIYVLRYSAFLLTVLLANESFIPSSSS